MSLIKCIECGKEISSESVNCIHCGKPMKEEIQTIEQTSKRWKRIKLVSWLGLIIGFIIMGRGVQNGGFDNPQTGLGITILFISFVALMVGKFGVWWTNR